MEGWWEGQRREHARGVGREGILWGMTGESRETNGAAQCACVELISSPLPFTTRYLPSLYTPRSPLRHSFAFPECWQRQRRAQSPVGSGLAASSHFPPSYHHPLSTIPPRCLVLLQPVLHRYSLFFSISCYIFSPIRVIHSFLFFQLFLVV